MSEGLSEKPDNPYQPYNQPGPVMGNQYQSNNGYNPNYPQQPYYNPDQPPYNPDQPSYNPDQPPNQAQYMNEKAKSNDPLAHLDDGLAGQARKKFIMKVYMILASKMI